MEKKLLLTAVVTLSLSANAQWVKPSLPAPDLQGQAVVTDGETEQYLYNVEKKAFFLGANDWNTRASVSDTLGFPVKITYVVDTEAYRITDLVAKFSDWRDMFVVDQESIWVDNNNGANHDMWKIEPLDGGINFKIYNDAFGRNVEETNTEGSWGYLSAPLDLNDTRLYLDSWFAEDEARGKGGSVWMSVTSEAYEAYVAGLKVGYPEYVAELARYNAAMNLKAVLDKAEADKNGADLTEEKAVFADTTSSLEALQAAAESAKEKCEVWKANQASVDNPQDVSGYIENATFDVVGDFHGWSGTAFGAGGDKSTCAEHFKKNFDTYQDVNGGKPIANGIYKVSVYGFYRAGSIDNDYATRDKAEYRHAKLYAISGEDSLYTGIPALSAWAIEGDELGKTQIGTTGLFVPNSMLDFTNWEDAGKGHQVELIIPVLDGKLRIGAKKETLIDNDWAIFDNFTLTYYGNALDAYTMWRDQVLETVLSDMQTYDWENMYYERAAKAEFEKGLADARAATDPQEIHDLTIGITSLVERVLASISTYTELNTKWENWKEAISQYDGDLVGAFLDRESEVMEVVEGGMKSTEDVRALINELQEQYDYAIKHSLQEGQDCTDMITNADFKNGKTGWTNAAGDAFGGTHGGLKSFPAGEVYEAVVDVQQTITDVPAGLYSISVNAFERPATNGNYTGDEEAKVFLFMGDLQTPVQNIAKDAQPEETAENYVNCFFEGSVNEDYYDTGGTKNNDYLMSGFGYVPNGMSGASYAFRAGRYVQKCYGLVGDDGIMKIGLTSNGQKVHWVLWANFKLTFEGKNAEGLKAALEPTVSGLEEWLSNHEETMTAAGYLAANNRIGKVLSTYDNSDDYDVLVALPAEINAIKAYVSDNEKLADDWRAAYDALNNAVGDFGDTASEAVLEEAVALQEEMDEYNPIDVDETTDEVAKEQIERMKEVTARLHIPACEDATDDDPVDMTQVIINPTFDDSNYNGWTLVKREGATGNYQTQDGFDGTKAMEFWSGSQGETTLFDFYQDINYLPAGTYELTVDAANSLNGQKPGAGEGAAYIYVATGADVDNLTFHNDKPIEVQEAPCNGDGCDYHNYSVVFTVAEGEMVRIGCMNVGVLSARWVMIDNFAMQYFGNASQKNPSEGTETIIKGLDIEKAAPAAIFDLAGRRVAKAVKGVYIINGKKVVK